MRLARRRFRFKLCAERGFVGLCFAMHLVASVDEFDPISCGLRGLCRCSAECIGRGATIPQAHGKPGRVGYHPRLSFRSPSERTGGHRRLSHSEVGTDGVPSGCDVTMSSGSALLDSATCDLIQSRARFSPAMDGQGRAVVGTYSNSVRWTIPDDLVPASISPTTQVLAFVVDEQGNVTNCRQSITTPSGTRELPGAGPCPGGPPKMAPFKDKSGKPVKRQVQVTTKIEVFDVAP